MASRESPDDFPDLTDEEAEALGTMSAADQARAEADAPAVVLPYVEAEPLDDGEPA